VSASHLIVRGLEEHTSSQLQYLAYAQQNATSFFGFRPAAAVSFVLVSVGPVRSGATLSF
jgi:hypothetical protein